MSIKLECTRKIVAIDKENYSFILSVKRDGTTELHIVPNLLSEAFAEVAQSNNYGRAFFVDGRKTMGKVDKTYVF